MAKNKKHIDDLFKDNLQGSPLPLDGSEWDRLFNELHPKKKKRFAWWWMAIGVVLISALGVVYTQWSKNATAVAVKSSEIQNPIDSSSNKNRGNIEPNTNIQEENTVDTDASAIGADASSNQEASFNNTAASDNSQNKNAQDPNTSGGHKATITNPTSKTTPSNQGDGSRTKTNTPDNNQKTGRSLTTISDLLSVNAKNVIALDWRQYFETIRMRSTVENNTNPLVYIYPMESLIDTLDPLKTPRFIDPYIGGSLGGSFLNQRLSSSITNYESYRNGNEQRNFAPSFGFDLGAGFKGFDVATGVKYVEKGQQSNPNYTYEIYDSIRRVDNQGNVSYLKWNYRDTTINGVPNPRYRYMSVPITIGKTIYSGTKFDLALGVNTNLQFLYGGTGTILSPDLSRVPVQRLSEFNRLSLTYGGYVSIGYALNDRMKIKLHTRIDADALDMMKHNDISQKMAGFGTDLSFQLKLKK